MGALINLVGQEFGKLTVIKKSGKTKHNHITWLCSCKCGAEKEVTGLNLRKGITKSCGCYHKEKMRLTLRKEQGLAGFNALYSRYKRNAKRRKYSFSLTRDDFKILTSSNCYYCGNPPSHKSKANPYTTDPDSITHSTYVYNGIDRLDNNRGYEESNTVPCCEQCNFFKSELDYFTFISLIKKIVNNLCL